MGKLAAAMISTVLVLCALVTSSDASHTRKHWSNLPLEWYAIDTLWGYGHHWDQHRPRGCLRWGAFNRSWYYVCGRR
jgi:hypothetical protein